MHNLIFFLTSNDHLNHALWGLFFFFFPFWLTMLKKFQSPLYFLRSLKLNLNYYYYHTNSGFHIYTVCDDDDDDEEEEEKEDEDDDDEL